MRADAVQRAVVGQAAARHHSLNRLPNAFDTVGLALFGDQKGEVRCAEGVEALGEFGWTGISRSIGLRCSFLACR